MNAEVLAAALTVVFEGLVAFVGPDAGGDKKKTHAAVVKAGHHPAHVTFTERGDQYPTEITLKEGDRITFSVASESARTESSFDDRVPTLTDYTAGDLHPQVKLAESHQDVLAYVDLPNGRLSADGVLDHPAQFTTRNGTKEIRCPAKNVRLAVDDTTDPIRITIEGTPPRRPMTRTLDVAREVTIGTMPTHLGSHFKEFGKLLRFGDALGFAGEITSQKCAADGRVLSEEEIRETGMVYPHTPNGDCGPVDFP